MCEHAQRGKVLGTILYKPPYRGGFWVERGLKDRPNESSGSNVREMRKACRDRFTILMEHRDQ